MNRSTTALNRLSRKPMSRRAMIGGATGLALGSSLLASPRGARADATIDLTIWNYAEDIVQDNAALFTQHNPSITVNVQSIAWPEFHTTMVNRFQSGTPTDVTYNGGNWLEEFAAAGWVVPLDEHFDWVAGYQERMLPFTWQDMTTTATSTASRTSRRQSAFSTTPAFSKKPASRRRPPPGRK